jgi:hypothetical protein
LKIKKDTCEATDEQIQIVANKNETLKKSDGYKKWNNFHVKQSKMFPVVGTTTIHLKEVEKPVDEETEKKNETAQSEHDKHTYALSIHALEAAQDHQKTIGDIASSANEELAASAISNMAMK